MSTPEMPPEEASSEDTGWREICLGEGSGLPPYMDVFLSPEDRAEGRRAYCLALLLDNSHTLNPAWATEVFKLESYLRSGDMPHGQAATVRAIGSAR